MSDAIQLSLFGNAGVNTVKGTQIQWSYSRRQTLERCARRYYYDYYGAKARLAMADPEKEEIRFLGTLSNRYLRSGEILHIAIRLFYKYGDSSREWLVDWARRTYRADYEYSRTDDGPCASGERYPPKMLLELYYSQPNAAILYAESEERLLSTLETFLFSPVYSAARDGGQRPSARAEQAIFVKTATFSARGKVDLAFPQGSGLATLPCHY